MLIRILCAICILVTMSSPAASQSQEPAEKVLLPLVRSSKPVNGAPFPGAHGSLWQVEFTAQNNSSESVLISTSFPCPNNTCYLTPPQSVDRPFINFPQPNAGAFVYIGRPGGDGKVALRLRVQDLSRQSLTHGTEIPIVRERDTFQRTLVLLDVPINERFRNTLRVYDFMEAGLRIETGEVFVRIYEFDSNVPLVDTKLTLSTEEFFGSPSHAFISDLANTFPQLAGAGHARVEVESATPGLRFWAFVSTTNNDTQHVTIVTPGNRE